MRHPTIAQRSTPLVSRRQFLHERTGMETPPPSPRWIPKSGDHASTTSSSDGSPRTQATPGPRTSTPLRNQAPDTGAEVNPVVMRARRNAYRNQDKRPPGLPRSIHDGAESPDKTTLEKSRPTLALSRAMTLNTESGEPSSSKNAGARFPALKPSGDSSKRKLLLRQHTMPPPVSIASDSSGTTDTTAAETHGSLTHVQAKKEVFEKNKLVNESNFHSVTKNVAREFSVFDHVVTADVENRELALLKSGKLPALTSEEIKARLIGSYIKEVLRKDIPDIVLHAGVVAFKKQATVGPQVSMSGVQAKAAIDAVNVALRKLQVKGHSLDDKFRLKLPRSFDLASAFEKDIGSLMSGDAIVEMGVRSLATVVADKLRNLGAMSWFGLATSDAQKLIALVADALDGAGRSIGIETKIKSRLAAELIVRQVLENLSETRFEADQNVLVVNKARYLHDKEIGQPSAGAIHLFWRGASVEKALDRVIMKTTKRGKNAGPLEFPWTKATQEARLHRIAMGDGCPNIARIEGVVRFTENNNGVERTHLGIILEYLPNGSLDRLVQKLSSLRSKARQGDVRSGQIADAVCIHIMHGVLNAVAHCHANNVLHLDINNRNFMLGEKLCPKLADFGEAVYTSPPPLRDKFPTDAPHYVAPEAWAIKKRFRQAADAFRSENKVSRADANLRIFNDNVERAESPFHITSAMDMWAVGVCFYELLKGTLPLDFNQAEGVAEIEEIFEKHARSSFDQRAMQLGLNPGNALDNIILRLLDPDPKARPSAAALLAQHPDMFKSLDDVAIASAERELEKL